jgi:hypothetical protein
MVSNLSFSGAAIMSIVADARSDPTLIDGAANRLDA